MSRPLAFVLAASIVVAQGVKTPVVAGYLPEWRYLNWPPEEQAYRWQALCEHLTHVIVFSIEVAGNGEITAADRLPSTEATARANAASQVSSAVDLIALTLSRILAAN